VQQFIFGIPDYLSSFLTRRAKAVIVDSTYVGKTVNRKSNGQSGFQRAFSRCEERNRAAHEWVGESGAEVTVGVPGNATVTRALRIDIIVNARRSMDKC
jgi:hypothetical protein